MLNLHFLRPVAYFPKGYATVAPTDSWLKPLRGFIELEQELFQLFRSDPVILQGLEEAGFSFPQEKFEDGSTFILRSISGTVIGVFYNRSILYIGTPKVKINDDTYVLWNEHTLKQL